MATDIRVERARSADTNIKKQLAYGAQYNSQLTTMHINAGNNYIARNTNRNIPTSRKKVELFHGIEITNINLTKSLKLKEKKDQNLDFKIKSEEDSLYEPLEYHNYLYTNDHKIILDNPYQIKHNQIVYNIGKLRTGSTCRKIIKKNEKSNKNKDSRRNSNFTIDYQYPIIKSRNNKEKILFSINQSFSNAFKIPLIAKMK